MNPLLTKAIPDSAKFKIYISALTSISLDDHNWIPVRDNRLLRRIIRDYNKGAFTAQQTISQWPNVCEAEDQWIFPYQETADVMFNSALNIEFAVLRPHAEIIVHRCSPSTEVPALLHACQRQGNPADLHHARIRRRLQLQVLTEVSLPTSDF